MAKQYKQMTYYLKLNWTYDVYATDDDLEPYTARVKELQGCMSHGKSAEEALHNIKDAIKSYILATKKIDEEVPEPLKIDSCSGRITYRTTKMRHYLLAKEAQKTGDSLNKYIDKKLEQLLVS